MFSPLRIFAPPEHPVQSLAVQAQRVEASRTRGRFEILVRHFLNSFLQNEMIASSGEAKNSLLQIAYAVALPQLVVAIFLFVPYHAPHPRSYWSQASDHYFYVLYSMVAVGAATVFEWDLFFPEMVDVFVLSSLPIDQRRLFQARVTAMAVFLFALIVGINLLGTIFFPAAADMPSLARHLAAHLMAVSGGGIFAAAFVLASQGLLVAVLGQSLFQRIAPLLQGLFVTVLLTMLFLFPVFSRLLSSLLDSHRLTVRCFPPFWFLGIYECILTGQSSGPAFGELAKTGILATLLAIALAVLVYPLAYWRKMRLLIEGRQANDTYRWLERPSNWMLHATLLRRPVSRAIYHFIGLTLVRTHRHRVYLAMYGGVGMALVISCALRLGIGENGRLRLLFSAEGLRAAVPIVAFWTIAGLRNAFVSPVDQRGSWVFRLIRGRPDPEELMSARVWVLLWATVVALSVVAVAQALTPAYSEWWRAAAIQVVAAFSLCLLLRDIFFLWTKTIPFTGVPPTSRLNLAVVLIEYFGLFPPLILLTLSVEEWMQTGLIHTIAAVAAAIAIHLYLRGQHIAIVARHAGLLDVDEDQEEFPQRLGLRY